MITLVMIIAILAILSSEGITPFPATLKKSPCGTAKRV